MRHPITGRRISREKYAEEEAAFAKQISEMKAEEQARVARIESVCNCENNGGDLCDHCLNQEYERDRRDAQRTERLYQQARAAEREAKENV